MQTSAANKQTQHYHRLPQTADPSTQELNLLLTRHSAPQHQHAMDYKPDPEHPDTPDPEALRRRYLDRVVNLYTRDCGPEGGLNLGKGTFEPPPESVHEVPATEAYTRELAWCILKTGDISLLAHYLTFRTSDSHIIYLSYEVSGIRFSF